MSELHPHISAAIQAAVRGLSAAFGSDELAFLATTSKVELPMRDRLAWLLHEALGEEFIVSREWKRADLAVLSHDTCLAQLEAKALYTFDILKEVKAGWNEAGYLGKLQRDAAKMASLAHSDRWLLSLITDVRGTIPQHLGKNVVKYASGISNAVPSPDEALQDTVARLWQEQLDNRFGATTSFLRIPGGAVWGLEVSVDVFLTGPLA